MKKFQSRQGDIFFRVVNKPKDLEMLKKHESKILAFGEVTGHSHQITSTTEVESYVNKNGDIFLFSKDPIVVGHDEHTSINLPSGKWVCVTRQREYDPLAADKERKVAD